nr:MAG: hypothetical protein DIU57_09080 [Pseudomonadota bacterium]
MLNSARAPSRRGASAHQRRGSAPASAGVLGSTGARPRSRRRGFRLTAFTTAIAGAVAFAALTHWGANARQVRPVLDEADRLAELAGLGVRQVFLTGHRMTSDRDIFDALDLSNARSLLRFDSLAARARIEQLPWIKQAAITRIFPDSISVEVTEREAFAVWRTSDGEFLIDVTGRVLGPAPPSMRANLPRLVGEGAAREPSVIVSILAGFPELQARVEEVVRVAKRRWTLRLANGPEIHLPAGREIEALKTFTSNLAARHLLDGRVYAAIDLRSPDRIVVRPRHSDEQKTASRYGAQPSG